MTRPFPVYNEKSMRNGRYNYTIPTLGVKVDRNPWLGLQITADSEFNLVRERIGCLIL